MNNATKTSKQDDRRAPMSGKSHAPSGLPRVADIEEATLIPLTHKGRFAAFAIVDQETHRRIAHARWYLEPAPHTNYARALWQFDFGWRCTFTMHRIVMGTALRNRSVCVDHLNHNGLDNRRTNLRICTPAQNAQNRRPKDQP